MRPQPRDEPSIQSTRALSIAAIVLAAGLSSRMGRNKLLAGLGGKPLIRHVVKSAASSRAKPILVVTGHEAEEVEAAVMGLSVTIVRNPDYRGGLSTSLGAGVRALPDRCDGALILLGDMPGVSPTLIDTLIAAFNPDDGRAICVGSFKGKRGNPVLWPRRFFPELLTLEGDVGAKHLIAANEEQVCEIEAGDDAPLIDIDTPEALQAVARCIA